VSDALPLPTTALPELSVTATLDKISIPADTLRFLPKTTETAAVISAALITWGGVDPTAISSCLQGARLKM